MLVCNSIKITQSSMLLPSIQTSVRKKSLFFNFVWLLLIDFLLNSSTQSPSISSSRPWSTSKVVWTIFTSSMSSSRSFVREFVPWLTPTLLAPAGTVSSPSPTLRLASENAPKCSAHLNLNSKSLSEDST
jgi:hypothetical protein